MPSSHFNSVSWMVFVAFAEWYLLDVCCSCCLICHCCLRRQADHPFRPSLAAFEKAAWRQRWRGFALEGGCEVGRMLWAQLRHGLWARSSYKQGGYSRRIWRLQIGDRCHVSSLLIWYALILSHLLFAWQLIVEAVQTISVKPFPESFETEYHDLLVSMCRYCVT